MNELENVKKSLIEFLDCALMQKPADEYDNGFASAMRLAICFVNREIRNLERIKPNE